MLYLLEGLENTTEGEKEEKKNQHLAGIEPTKSEDFYSAAMCSTTVLQPLAEYKLSLLTVYFDVASET